MRVRWRGLPWISIAVLALLVLIAILAPWISPHDPEEQALLSRLDPPAWTVGGDWSYPLGSDGLGRDLLSNIFYGLRVSLLVGFVAVAISVLIGGVAGLVAGYRSGRWFDTVAMRLVDIQLALPAVLIALAVLALSGRGLWKVIAVIGVTGWAQYARLVRASVLSERERDYVIAAMLAGASSRRDRVPPPAAERAGAAPGADLGRYSARGRAGGLAVVSWAGCRGNDPVVGLAREPGISVPVQRRVVAVGPAGLGTGAAGAVGEPDWGLGARRAGPAGTRPAPPPHRGHAQPDRRHGAGGPPARLANYPA